MDWPRLGGKLSRQRRYSPFHILGSTRANISADSCGVAPEGARSPWIFLFITWGVSLVSALHRLTSRARAVTGNRRLSP